MKMDVSYLYLGMTCYILGQRLMQINLNTIEKNPNYYKINNLLRFYIFCQSWGWKAVQELKGQMKQNQFFRRYLGH